MSETPASGSETGLRARTLGLAARALLGVTRAVPRRTALRAAGGLGRGYARLGLPRTATARRNLRLAFPDWKESERRRVLERTFANLARCFVEFAWQSRMDDAALRELVEVEGFEHWDAARAASPTGGIIAMTAHLGNWELFAAIMAAHDVPISVVVHPRESAILDAMVAGLRSRSGVELLPLGSAARGSLRALRDGRVLAVPIDQNAPRNEGVFVPFFGRLASSRDGPARIALRTGTPVVMAFIERIDGGERHRVRIEPPIVCEPSRGEARVEAVRELVARTTARVEAAIRRAPDQWIWTHRRWRTQPVGEARPYPPRGRGRSLAQMGGTAGR